MIVRHNRSTLGGVAPKTSSLNSCESDHNTFLLPSKRKQYLQLSIPYSSIILSWNCILSSQHEVRIYRFDVDRVLERNPLNNLPFSPVPPSPIFPAFVPIPLNAPDFFGPKFVPEDQRGL